MKKKDRAARRIRINAAERKKISSNVGVEENEI